MSVADYYDRVNPELLRMIPPGLSSVVEIGCGAGSLGAAYKAANPGCHWHGLEINPEAAALACSRLDSVTVADIDQGDAMAALSDRPVDAFIYGDVLEHLREPWEVVRLHAGRLQSGGLAIACIPNVQNWTLIENLLRGQWPYQPEGLMDRTHIRWFTLDGMISLFRDAGLVPLDMVPRMVATRGHEGFVSRMEPVIAAMGLDRAQFVLRTRALQYVIRSRKP